MAPIYWPFSQYFPRVPTPAWRKHWEDRRRGFRRAPVAIRPILVEGVAVKSVMGERAEAGGVFQPRPASMQYPECLTLSDTRCLLKADNMKEVLLNKGTCHQLHCGHHPNNILEHYSHNYCYNYR